MYICIYELRSPPPPPVESCGSGRGPAGCTPLHVYIILSNARFRYPARDPSYPKGSADAGEVRLSPAVAIGTGRHQRGPAGTPWGREVPGRDTEKGRFWAGAPGWHLKCARWHLKCASVALEVRQVALQVRQVALGAPGWHLKCARVALEVRQGGT